MNDENLEISVVPVQEADYSAWLPYWLSYQKFYGVELPEETTLATWGRFFDADEPMYCAVAKEGETLLGFVHYVFHRSTWSVSDFCYLEDLFVAANSRGKQTGKHLIDYVQRQASERQCGRLYWHTQEKNVTAQRLYDWVAEKPGVIEYRMPL
ncbi:GNAT family N-acetyltransferase [Erwinia rhapontici]|uniref:GNAT family N-acetyltransferase n=1 Tax=Erwinia rhapontici TaxID=55212 RepID=UPI0021679847|nr:GNAT family N-acetyltransferase [Erwinia rhapontici]MCS3605657.1 GNAT superfamily N-acetyltransferase [Erwinia rhapontici]